MLKSATRLLLFSLASCLHLTAIAEEPESVAWARENLQAGKYSEAVDQLQQDLAKREAGSKERREVALVLIETWRIQGKLADARALCEELLKIDAKDAAVRLLKAELDTEVGQYKEALEIYDSVVADEPTNLRARALRTIVYRALGNKSGLKASADYFFELYEKNGQYSDLEKVKDPRELAYIGLGVMDENPKDAFEVGFLLSEELHTKRNLREPEVFLWSARLARDKYHFKFADDRYNSILKMRPRLPEALAGKAAIVLSVKHDLNDVEKILKESLAVNPNHVESLLLMSSVDLQEDRFEDAKKHLDAALATNPNHLEALGLLAYYHIDLAQMDKAKEVEERALKINPRCSDFFCDIGEAMENKRGFNTAAEYYQRAIDLDPEHWRGYYGLGMNICRQGAHKEEEGKAILLNAFKRNKFNVWALNMIKSMDRFVGDKETETPPVYAESRTKHFILKYHAKEAEIVRPYLEEWAEAAYESQTKKFGFEPQGPLTIELCHSFQDQAARTVGLPNLGALGVCFGKLCTVVSPREGKGDGKGAGSHPAFNWRKVLEHEFGHVMVLQLTDYKVPRWYTEAFSTYLEDDSRIQSDRMMVDAIAKGDLKDIDRMNEYFRGNIMMAYVHGRYVIEYIDKQFGFNAHIKALKMFAEGKKVDEALPLATGTTIKELSKGQLDFVKKSFKDVRLRPSLDPAMIVQLELAAKAENASADAMAEFAAAQVAIRRKDVAETWAKKALEKDPKCVDALNVMGALAFDKKDFEAAKQQYILSTGIDATRSFAAWQRLGVIYKKEGKTTKAIEAFEAARKAYPRYVGADNPHEELPELYEDAELPEKALEVWRDCVRINTENAPAALKGLKLAMKLKDIPSAIAFTNAYNEIDPYNIEVHRLGGKAFEDSKDHAKAAREFGVAVAIDDKDVESWIALARNQKALSKREEAMKSIQQALDIDATHTEAKALRDSLK